MNNNDIIQENNEFSIKISPEKAGQRIDIFLTEQLPMFSRSLIKKLLINHQVIINHTTPAKPSYTIKEHDTITLLSIPIPTERLKKKIDHNLGITVIVEHTDFVIINKPAGLVVHPPQQTFTEIALTDWLVHQYPQIINVGDPTRPGIVHRLDRNTSGIMIIALTSQAHVTLSAMFKQRAIQKTYLALVVGHPEKQGIIDYYIGRHPVQKNLMHCFTSFKEDTQARDALTSYTVLQYFDTFSFVEVRPKTGRTHQIRVHFKALGHPLLGDTVYGSPSKMIGYHALHAQKLEFTYQGQYYQFSTELDPVLQKILDRSIQKKQ